jgi:DNA-binding transcriptional LysR family regulator
VARIRDAETFVAIVDAEGLSAAARQLGRTQPTVSRQLAALEARLGVRLLERSTRRLRLTIAGRTYYERCRELLAMLRDADELVADMGDAIRGGVRVSMPPTYARRRVAPLLPAFFRAFPELWLEIVLTGERTDLVGAHFDLVVRLGALRDSTLRCRVLSTERFVLCASPIYLDRHGAPASVAALAGRSAWSPRRSGCEAGGCSGRAAGARSSTFPPASSATISACSTRPRAPAWVSRRSRSTSWPTISGMAPWFTYSRGIDCPAFARMPCSRADATCHAACGC